MPGASAVSSIVRPEVPQLHHLALPRIGLGQLLQRLVEGRQIHAQIAPLGGRARARLVEERAAHHSRGNATDVRAVLTPDAVLLHELEVGLVDEGRGLQGRRPALAAQVLRGEARAKADVPWEPAPPVIRPRPEKFNNKARRRDRGGGSDICAPACRISRSDPVGRPFFVRAVSRQAP
jgi:hypothetical protein